MKQSVLFSLDDLLQEAAIVLWKVLKTYPQTRDEELVKLYRTALKNRFASLFRPGGVRLSKNNCSLDDLLSEERTGVKGKRYIRICGDGSVTPWTFYQSELDRLGKRIGRRRLREYIHGDRRGRLGLRRGKAVVLSAL